MLSNYDMFNLLGDKFFLEILISESTLTDSKLFLFLNLNLNNEL